MNKVNIIVELNHSTKLEKAAGNLDMGTSSGLSEKSVIKSELFKMDTEFGTAEIPNIINHESDYSSSAKYESNGDFGLDADTRHSTYIIRGEVAEKDLKAFETEMSQNKDVVGIYADVAIEPQLICPGSPATGNASTVENLLCVSKMKEKGMTGRGVFVAIVDTGINMNHLRSQGKNPGFNSAWSWKPSSSSVIPGSAPTGHGTMCAFDVCIAAPECTLLDIALLTSTAGVMEGLLSDAIKAYEHMIKFFNRAKRPGENASLVVNNSWGMFHQSWDYPVGHPGNYSHNPNHPFNLIVKKLALLGADILFAAGNCGPECPDGRCQGVTNAGIYGANSSPYVTSVAGIATNNDRVGYSNKGPGCLTNKKPDITGYTHFHGSGVYSADGGTSAACPVVAGVFAAIRTNRPFNSGSSISSPDAVRNLVTSTARDVGAGGWDYFYGFGVVNGCEIVKKMHPVIHIDICKRYPRICDIIRKDNLKIIDICKRYPAICNLREIERIVLPPDIIKPKPGMEDSIYDQVTEPDYETLLNLIEISLGGTIDTQETQQPYQGDKIEEHGCNCGCQ